MSSIDRTSYNSSITSFSPPTQQDTSNERKVREGDVENLNQQAIGSIQHGNRIEINSPIGASSQVGPLTTEMRTRMLADVVIKVYEKKFVSFVNGLFQHGIVCSKQAKDIKIKQVSSLDKNPRPENEVEVNFISDLAGLETAIGANAKGGGNAAAKGALSIALERFRDPLPSTIKEATIDENEEKYISSISKDISEGIRKMLLQQKKPHIPKETLDVLSNRAESCVLIFTNPQGINFYKNDPKLAEPNEMIKHLEQNCAIHQDFFRECGTPTSDQCREIKINANISPQSFDLVLIPERFKHLASKLKIPNNCEVRFVESKKNVVYYNYTPLDSKKDSRTVITHEVEINSPNFISAAREYLNKNKCAVSHLSKGTALSDL